MEVEERLAIVSAQEELLKFETFTHEDAWELGKIFVAEAMDKDLKIAICIKLMSGLTLFQYSAEGANLSNETWIDRKFRTVQNFEMSTLHYALWLKKRGTTLVERGLDPTKFVACGGGFPIYVEGVGTVGVAIVSGLTDVQDHDVLITCISKYLGEEDVPRYPVI
ncbi:MAG: heme-binding protein [Sphaerochaeta sp.]|nr:heme-binding protein [Sphaerochaeta sp.]